MFRAQANTFDESVGKLPVLQHLLAYAHTSRRELATDTNTITSQGDRREPHFRELGIDPRRL